MQETGCQRSKLSGGDPPSPRVGPLQLGGQMEQNRDSLSLSWSWGTLPFSTLDVRAAGSLDSGHHDLHNLHRGSPGPLPRSSGLPSWAELTLWFPGSDIFGLRPSPVASIHGPQLTDGKLDSPALFIIPAGSANKSPLMFYIYIETHEIGLAYDLAKRAGVT